MLLVAKRQVNSIEHKFSYPTPFIEQAVDMSVCHHHEAAVRRGILQVGTQHPPHGREVREPLRDCIQVYLAQLGMDFFHSFSPGKRMDPERSIVFTCQPDIGGNIFYVAVQNIIVSIQLKRAESQYRIFWKEMQPESFFLLVDTDP